MVEIFAVRALARPLPKDKDEKTARKEFVDKARATIDELEKTLPGYASMVPPSLSIRMAKISKPQAEGRGERPPA